MGFYSTLNLLSTRQVSLRCPPIRPQIESRSPSDCGIKLPSRAFELLNAFISRHSLWPPASQSKLNHALHLVRRRTRRQRPIRPPHRFRPKDECHPTAFSEYILPGNPRTIPILPIHLQTLNIDALSLISATACNQQRLRSGSSLSNQGEPTRKDSRNTRLECQIGHRVLV